MPRATVLASLTIVALLACRDATAPIAEGSWGGREASLELTGSGGSLSYACGSGTIDSGWTITRDGRLTGTGEHFFGGGPVPPGGRPPHPARYTGRLTEDRLSLTVTLTDLHEVLGPFAMVRGGPPVAERCE